MNIYKLKRILYALIVYAWNVIFYVVLLLAVIYTVFVCLSKTDTPKGRQISIWMNI